MRKPSIYIIQTNTSLDKNNKSVDFQSMVYGYSEPWEEFKNYLLSSDDFTEKLIKGTLYGCTKPNSCKINKILINDEYHLEIELETATGIRFNSKYSLVTIDQFKNLTV